MAKAFINYVGTELSKTLESGIHDVIDGKTLEFETKNSDLDLDGHFVDTVRYETGLWDTIKEENKQKLNKLPKPKRVESNIDAPGVYNIEVETSTETYKGKIKIKAPPSSDDTSRKIKKNSKPPHVKVKFAGVKLADCPTQFKDDLKDLTNKMDKTASYEYVGGSGSSKGWEPKFAGHQCHEQPGKGWKAYIDEPSMGTGTTWRLYFTLDFDVNSKTLNVSLTQVKQDH